MDDWKQISLVWQGEMNFKARNASGASVQMGILAGQDRKSVV